MTQLYQYETEEEMQEIIAVKAEEGLVLVEVQNLTTVNFIGFVPIEDAQKDQELFELRQKVADYESIRDQLAVTQDAIDFILMNMG